MTTTKMLLYALLSLHSVVTLISGASINLNRKTYYTPYINGGMQEAFEKATIYAIRTGKINITIDTDSDARIDNTARALAYSNCRVRAVPTSVKRRLRLGSRAWNFYEKYAHAYGIPVLGSRRVQDKAIIRACYVMRFLFADRLDVRNWFYRRRGRAGIMALSEGTTSIPEHTFLGPWWNQRARGLGATIAIPISTGGEENLLCSSSDRYRNEDIFLHEFVHGIHNLGATAAIPSFDRRLRAAYNYARRIGLWRNTYAMSTDREYFSEGTQSFFNVNAYSARPDGVHNHVNTREKLRRYDPTLYNLVKEVFPCANTYFKRCTDKDTNGPPPAFKMNCKDGGGTIVTNRPPTGNPNTRPTQKPKPTLTVCTDQNRSCNRWARGGECDKNPGYMLKYCCQSCKKKPASCVDKYPAYCSKYGRTYCRSSSYSRNCRRTCGCTR